MKGLPSKTAACSKNMTIEALRRRTCQRIEKKISIRYVSLRYVTTIGRYVSFRCCHVSLHNHRRTKSKAHLDDCYFDGSGCGRVHVSKIRLQNINQACYHEYNFLFPNIRYVTILFALKLTLTYELQRMPTTEH